MLRSIHEILTNTVLLFIILINQFKVLFSLIMLNKLAYDPKPKPSIPIIIMMISLIHITTNSLPEHWSQNVINSINGGKIKASAELLKDPTKEIIDDRFGMAAAKATVKKIFQRSINTNFFYLKLIITY